MNKLVVGIVMLLGLFTACIDKSYVENFTLLDSSNSILKYPDSTVVFHAIKSPSVFIAKPDTFGVAIKNFPFVIGLDTIIGKDDNGADIINIYKKTVVDPKTGIITINNGTNLFKTGKYEIYVGFLTENGFIKFRNKPIKLDIVP
ncbi:MAG: hypothetical protein PHV20_02075 [Bacteroidales bacterium]|nr:hypothetical protein [Bacteroidales bacterium]